jgi:hypothetical protein
MRKAVFTYMYLDQYIISKFGLRENKIIIKHTTNKLYALWSKLYLGEAI